MSDPTSEYRDDWEQEPCCPHCGGAVEWRECEECGGEGGWYPHEISPIEYPDPDEMSLCQICEGAGGDWCCVNSREWCEAHPRDEAKGRGFYATSPAGNTMHVNGARDMPEETLALIGQIADLAMAQYLRSKEATG